MNIKEQLELTQTINDRRTQEIGELLASVLRQADACHLVVRIRTVPLKPLAMGHYTLEASVDPSRKMFQYVHALEQQVKRYEQLLALPVRTPAEQAELDQLENVL